MSRICLKCGSIEWCEDVSGVTYTFTTDENGRIVEIDRDSWGEVSRIYCAECDEDNPVYIEDLKLTETEIQKLLKMSNEERLEFLKRKGILKE